MGQGPRHQAAQIAYDGLLERILTLELKPGEAIDEKRATELLDLGRTPIREALNWLAHDGLLERASRGFRVRSGTPEDVIEIYAARVALDAAAREYLRTYTAASDDQSARRSARDTARVVLAARGTPLSRMLTR